MAARRAASERIRRRRISRRTCAIIRGFIQLFKWGAIVCLVIALIVILIIN